ncbi:AI-2E family transporter [Butyricicoccus sp.]|uniref:AI-2E family transporter n=1 Tax=Butyricicoccus sp. TaxID=2049021 RepID=UPI003F1485C8
MEHKTIRREFRILIGIGILFLLLIYGKTMIHSAGSVLGFFRAFIIGIALAFILNRPHEAIRKGLMKRGQLGKRAANYLAVLMVYLLIAAVIAALFGVIIPQIAASVRLFKQNFGAYVGNLQMELDTMAQLLHLKPIDMSSVVEWINSSLMQFNDTTGTLVETVVTATGTAVHMVATTLIAIVFSIYLLAGKQRILNQTSRLFRAYLPESVYAYLRYVKQITVNCFENYIVGQGMEAVILGTLCLIGMEILRLEYAGLVSIVVAVTAIIPVLGAYLGGAVAFVLLFMVSPMKAGIFLIFFILLQQVENKLIYPRVVGGRIGLSGIWVLLAITVGTELGGIVGTIFGVPVTSVIYTLLKDGVKKREQQKKQAQPAAVPENEQKNRNPV